jgi:hypothetical protein
MRGQGTLAATVIAVAGLAAGCGERAASPDHVERQLEKQFGDGAKFVECDSGPQSSYTCRVETSSDRYRYVATCPTPGAPCTIRRTGREFK